MAQAFLTPKRDQKNIHIKYVILGSLCYDFSVVNMSFYIFSHATLNKTFTAKYDAVLPRTP